MIIERPTTTRLFRRLLGTSPVAAAVIAAALLTGRLNAVAQEAVPTRLPAPTALGEAIHDNWDGGAITTADAPSPATGEDAASLAKRVEALEQELHRLKVQPALAEELVPPKKDGKDSKDGKEGKKDVDECLPKKVDIQIKPTFTPTGRVYFDGVTYDEDPANEAFFHSDRDNELGFRTFRLGGKGNLWENLAYTFEFEIRGTNSAITYKDIYMEQQNLPVLGHFRAGHFKEPIGLEEFGSDLYLSYMEKSPATQAFTPSRNFGVMAWDTFDACQDASWFVGGFRIDSPDSPMNTGLWRSDEDDWAADARVAWLPYYDEPSNGRYLIHLGTSYSFRRVGAFTQTGTYNQNVAYSTYNGLAEFSTRSWVGSQGPLGFGTEADTNQWNQVNAEALAIWGPASVQSEYFQLLMNGGEQFNGGYTFVSYFLTGENRAYRKDLKTIDRTQPLEPFFWVDSCRGGCCGRGAWELTCGYSWVDLEDGHDTVATTPANNTNRRRGFNNNVIVGVNWYQNPWSRVFFDYEHEMVNFVDAGVPNDNTNIFGVRWQIDW